MMVITSLVMLLCHWSCFACMVAADAVTRDVSCGSHSVRRTLPSPLVSTRRPDDDPTTTTYVLIHVQLPLLRRFLCLLLLLLLFFLVHLLLMLFGASAIDCGGRHAVDVVADDGHGHAKHEQMICTAASASATGDEVDDFEMHLLNTQTTSHCSPKYRRQQHQQHKLEADRTSAADSAAVSVLGSPPPQYHCYASPTVSLSLHRPPSPSLWPRHPPFFHTTTTKQPLMIQLLLLNLYHNFNYFPVRSMSMSMCSTCSNTGTAAASQNGH